MKIWKGIPIPNRHAICEAHWSYLQKTTQPNAERSTGEKALKSMWSEYDCNPYKIPNADIIDRLPKKSSWKLWANSPLIRLE